MSSKDPGTPRINKGRISFVGACLFSAFFLLLFPFSEDAFPWRGQVHTRMTNDALRVMPKMPDDIFKKHAKELREGAMEPDKNRVIKHDDIRDVGMMIEILARNARR